MPVRCIAIGCRNTIDIRRKPAVQIELEKVVKITFHSFPSDPVRKAEWIRILGLENKIISNRSRLCSLHFKEKHIDRTSLVCVRLRENAVPHASISVFHKNIENKIFEDVDDKMDTNETVSALPEFLDTQVKTEDCFEESANCKLDTVAVLKCDKGTDTSMSPAKRSTQDKGTRISPERIWTMNFSNMEIIRKASNAEIEHLRKRIRTLKQQISRKDKKIDIIKSMLSL